MIHAHRSWTFWLVYTTTFLSLIEVAKFDESCDPKCVFLKASKCLFLQEPTHVCEKDETHYPRYVSALLENLPRNIRMGIVNGSFQAQTIEDLVKIPPSLLNLIPIKQIHFSAENVSAYLHKYSQELSVAIKLISSLNSSLERKSFLENWNGDESNPKIEDIVASALTRWQRDVDWNFLVLVHSSSTVLLRVPPQFLLAFNSKAASEFLFHLGSKFNSLPPGKVAGVFKNIDPQNLKFLRRAWAVLALREFPEKIKWTKYNFVMPGLTLDELKDLEFDDVKPFLSFDFSTSQIRTIVSRTIVPWQMNFDQVAAWVKFLSPSQIQTLWRLNFTNLRIDANETASYATAKQILLYQLFNIDEAFISEGKYVNLSSSNDLLKLGSGFVSVLPLKMIQELSHSSILLLESLHKIDSNLMSVSTAYYLTDESRIFNLQKPSPKLTGIRGMLKALPTSKIMALTEDMSSLILHHLLQQLQGDNILRNLELLRKCRPTLGNAEYILKPLLENKDKNEYFRLLSPKDVARISLKTINGLARDNYGQRVKELPHHILAAILSNNSPGLWTWNNMLNSSNAFDTLLMGLNCNELRKIEDSDFISIIGRYNDIRLKMGKVFPKNLQRCGQLALSDYLLLKSNLYNEPELLDLLEPSDIEAVGGYILASLSAEEILHAKYSKEIISAIGQLSLPELMLTTSREHLNALTDEYFNKAVKISDLLLLKNLIHFISASNLRKIEPNDVKYVIESGMIDKRLCGDSETRNAWSKLLISIYGLPSKWNASQLESVGDLMVALSPDQLDSIDSPHWQVLADIAVTKYTEFIEWSKFSSFYRACQSTLIKSEQKSYLEAVRSLQRKYFIEVQKLISSIKLNIKNDSIVLLKTNTSSLESLPKPKVISLDEYEDDGDVLPEDAVEYLPDSAESEEAPSNPSTKKTTTSVPLVNHVLNVTTSLESEKLSSVSDRYYSSKLRNSKSAEAGKFSPQEYKNLEEKLSPSDLPSMTEISMVIPDELAVTFSEVKNEQEDEVSPEVLSTTETKTPSTSPNSVVYTEIHTVQPTVDRKSLRDGAVEIPAQAVYLSQNPFSIDEEDDDDDAHVKVFGPEIIENDSEGQKSSEKFGSSIETSPPSFAVEVDNMADASNQFTFSSLSDSKKSSEEESVEKTDSTPPVLSAVEESESVEVAEEPKSVEVIEDFSDVSVERISFKDSRLIVKTSPKEQNSTPAPLEVSDMKNVGESFGDFLLEGFRKKATTVMDLPSASTYSSPEKVTDVNGLISTSTTPHEIFDMKNVGESFGDFLFAGFKKKATTVMDSSSASKNSSPEKVTDTNSLISTTTEIPRFDDIGDQFGAFIFGPEIVQETKKLQKGFGSFFGMNKAEKLSTVSSTTTDNSRPMVTDFLEETMKPNEDSGTLVSTKNESQESPTDITTLISAVHIITPSISSDAYEPLTKLDQGIHTTLWTAEGQSDQTIVGVSSTSAPFAREQDPESEEDFHPSNFLDFDDLRDGENITILERLSDLADMDYKQPKPEVFSGQEDDNSTNSRIDYSGPAVDIEFPLEYFPSHIASKRNTDSVPMDDVLDFEPKSRLFHSKSGFNRAPTRSRRSTEPVSNSVFCDSVKVLGPSAELAIQESDLHSVNNDELLNCVEDLGKLDLPDPFKEIIWQRVKSLQVLKMTVGSLAGVWKMDDVNNLHLNISEDWSLEVIYLLSKYNMDSSVGRIIVDKMKKQILTDEMSEVSEAVMVAMGPLLCYLNLQELQLMFRTPGTFMHVIPIIGEMMQGCQMQCLSKFAKLAVAFMDPADSWTSDIVALLGPIPAGLDAENWRLLIGGPRSMSGLQPKALECLPQSLLQMMSAETMSILPPLTTKALTDKQLRSLDKGQKDVLISIKYEHWSLRNSTSLQRSNIDSALSPNVEVDLSSSCKILTPSIFITVFSIALLLS